MYNYHMYAPMPYAPSDSVENIHGVGKTKNTRYDRFQFHMARIDTHPDYVISRDGAVYEFETGQEVMPYDENTVILDNQRCNIDYLLLWGYIGNLPLPVIPRSTRPITKMYVGRRCSALTYKLPQPMVNPDNPGFVYCGKVKFKLVPFAKYLIGITENGVLYDFSREDFIMRSFSWGYAVATFSPDPDKAREMRIGASGDFGGSWRISNILYMTYKGPIPSGMQVDHVDNIRYHDNVDNLELLTAVENSRKSRREGARKTDFDDATIDTIAKMLSEGKTNPEIAEAIGFSYETRKDRHRLAAVISKMRRQKGYYEDVRAKYGLNSYDPNNSYPFNRLGADMYEQIRAEAASGMKGIELARKYNVSPGAISRIINRKTKADLKAQDI